MEPSANSVASRCWPIRSTRRGSPAAIAVDVPVAHAMMAAPIAVSDGDIVVTGSSKRIETRDLGDVKLYALPEATTLAANQIKQVQFIDQSGVKVQRFYRHDLPTLICAAAVATA